MFVWKIRQNRIPSLQNLTRRNVPLQSTICKGCEKENESAGHLFFACDLFSSLWYECLKWWGVIASLHGDCKSHFLLFSGLITGNSDQVVLWELIWFVVIWVIWSAYNALIFKGKKVEIGEMMEHVMLKSWLWVTARRPQFNYPVSSWFSNPSGLGLRMGCSSL